MMSPSNKNGGIGHKIKIVDTLVRVSFHSVQLSTSSPYPAGASSLQGLARIHSLSWVLLCKLTL